MDDDDFIPISALQHYAYCPRQCALIHVERLWADNRQTVEGHLLHERSDRPLRERRRGIRTVSAMPLSCPDLGIVGVADVVEFHTTEVGERICPVEYKRGKPKSHRADEVQLCAQALSLEVMLGKKVTEGAIFYGTPRRRTVIVFDEPLRNVTVETILAAREMIRLRRTPLASYEPGRCDACSLIDLCQPRLLRRAGKVQAWLLQQIEDKD